MELRKQLFTSRIGLVCINQFVNKRLFVCFNLAVQDVVYCFMPTMEQ